MMRVDVPISDNYRSPLRDALIVQVVLALLSKLALDFGDMARLTLVALVPFWVGVLLILLRRPRNPTRVDLWLIRWSSLPLVVAVQVAGRAVWHWRGLA